MAKSTFCKPGERKYPVPDCSHAKVAMAYAKKHNESAAVISCIRRKAKALGCPFNGKDDFDGWEVELDSILTDLAEREAADTANNDADVTVNQGSVVEPTDNQDTTDTNDSVVECASCVAQKDKVEALRQELADIYAEFNCAQQAHIEDIEKLKAALVDAVTKLELLEGKDIKVEDEVVRLAEMPLADLLQVTDTTSNALDMDAILTKVHDGMANVPEGQVQDPTLNSDANTDPSSTDKSDSADEFEVIRATYRKIFEKKGFHAADEYIKSLRRYGLVPSNFDPEK